MSAQQGIIQDLFPGVVIPEQDYGVLQKEAVKCCFDKGLQAPDYFILKVIQFFETLVVRHGVMLVSPACPDNPLMRNCFNPFACKIYLIIFQVGKTGGGKTTCYEVIK
jgi:hypothetical protein